MSKIKLDHPLFYKECEALRLSSKNSSVDFSLELKSRQFNLTAKVNKDLADERSELQFCVSDAPNIRIITDLKLSKRNLLKWETFMFWEENLMLTSGELKIIYDFKNSMAYVSHAKMPSVKARFALHPAREIVVWLDQGECIFEGF